MNFSCNNLSFYYGKKKVLNNICFSLKNKDVLIICGPNGVGKTTLLKIIANQIKTKSFIQSHEVSFMIDNFALYPYLTGKENLEYFSNLFRGSLLRQDEVLTLLGLTDAINLKVKNYSYGMKQKLGIARTLLKDADIYLFDEPLNGLDSKSIINFRILVNKLIGLNKIVIISSHILSECQYYATKVLVIKNNIDHYFFDLNSKKCCIEDIIRRFT